MASWNLYNTFKEGQHDSTQIDLEYTVSTDIKIMLVTSAYTPADAHDYYNDVSANEVSGTGYTAGGNVCATPAVTRATSTTTFDVADPATWTQDAAGFSNARRAIIYQDTGTDTTSKLIAYSDDFGADRGNVSGDFSIQIDAAGVFTAT
jgi:hypothetical protein